VAEISTSISPVDLDVGATIGAATTERTGGLGVFVGTVRATPAATDAPGRSVVRLEYEAHPTLAEDTLRDLARAAAAKWDLERIVATHRTGTCEVGEPTVIIACSAEHRAEALDACRWLIDEIKTTVPIWKREVYADGSSWVGTEGTP
jgi:molybdopterin synthase catalytic subunit